MVRWYEPGREDHEFDPKFGNFFLVRKNVIVELHIIRNTFVISHLLFIDYVVCLCHVLLLISMHCGLLEGEFSEFSCSESNLLLLFILLLVFAMLCCLF